MAAVARLILQDFRSYEALDLPVEGQIVALAGENGAGKTNILEALSLFTPGRGLRRAEITAMARQGGDGNGRAGHHGPDLRDHRHRRDAQGQNGPECARQTGDGRHAA